MYLMKQSGWVEVICGSMFSGKSEELIRRVRRAQFAKQNIAVFKPKIDNRYHEQSVVSHNGSSFHATPISHSIEILHHVMACQLLMASGVLKGELLEVGDRLPLG